MNYSITNLDKTANGLLAVLFLVVIHYLYLYQPVAYVYLVAEDSWAEYATFVLFFMSFLVLSRALLKNPQFRKPGHYGLAALAFFVAMEEISWGQRILHIDVPEVIRQQNTQGELNLHNFINPELYISYIGAAILVGAITLPVLTFLMPRLHQVCDRLGIPIVPPRHWPLFIVTVYLFDYYYHFVNLSMNREVAELGLGLAVFVMITDWVPGLQNGRDHARQRLLLAGLAIVGTTILVLYFDDPRGLKYRLQTMSSRDYVQRGYLVQAAELSEFISKNPQFSVGAHENIEYYHGLILMGLGRKEEAQAVLRVVLEKARGCNLVNPADTDCIRDAGRALQSLDRIQEAQQAYLRALNMDRAGLLGAEDGEVQAGYRLSLAKTLFAMGLVDPADEQIQLAAETTNSEQVRRKYLRWIRYEKARRSILQPGIRPALNTDFPPIPGIDNTPALQ